MKNALLNPVAIYRYKRHVAPDGSTGTRWDYVGHEGQEYPELVYTLKRSGEKVMYLNKPAGKPNARRPALGLYRGGGKCVSGVFEPNIKMPGKGFGDLNRADALLTNRDEQAGTFTILVFPGLGKQAAVLFEQWGTGAVRESLPSNNVILTTLSVQPDPE
jgi:hypothetical protein